MDGGIPRKMESTPHHALHAVAIVLLLSSIAIQILTTCLTQQFVRQSHDQNQTFPLGQTSTSEAK